jgi:hypothetical protein
MHLAEIESITGHPERAPIAFDYFKDAYAGRLLELAIGGGRPVSLLKRSPFARLLEKPSVQRALSLVKNAVLRPAQLSTLGPETVQHYRITFGRWGSSPWDPYWDQTSRPGFNLVLQLNFPAEHDRAYRHLIRAKHAPFATDMHPVRTGDCLTLGWARLDADRDSGEALIEEVQSDWVRGAAAAAREALAWLGDGEPSDIGPDLAIDSSAAEVLTYVEQVLKPHLELWHEAVLCAAIWFLHEELGTRRIFFHDYDSSAPLKGMAPGAAPRSLYTALPRRFCFQRTKRAPAFISSCSHPTVQERLETKDLHWFVLEPSDWIRRL